MPIFEYRCRKCGGEFEELVPSSAREVECPKCGSDDVEKLFSGFSSIHGPGAEGDCFRSGARGGCSHSAGGG